MEFVDNEPFIEHFMEGASSVRTQLFIYLCRYGWVDNAITDLTWSEAIFGNRIVWDSSGSLLYQIISMSDFGSGVS